MKKASGALLRQLGVSLARSGGKHIFIWNLDDNENARRYTSRRKAVEGEMAQGSYGDDPLSVAYLPALLNEKLGLKVKKPAGSWAKTTSWRAAKNEADVPPERLPWKDGYAASA